MIDPALAHAHADAVSDPVPLLPVPSATPRIGRGRAIGHHGEILQGVFDETDGRLVRGLVTLAVRRLRATAAFHPADSGPLRVEPGWKLKACRAAELTLAQLGRPRSGLLSIDSAIEPRWGFGSSTSDVVAAVRAVAAAFAHQFAPETVATMAVQSETASDSTMFGERAVLFAQRRGVILEDFGPRLPPMHVIGFNLDPTGWGVDTLAFPPARYSCWEIEAFRPLRGLLRRAICTQDAGLLGRVASASARINQRHLPKAHFDDLERLVDRCQALGLQVAHSGSLVGILLRPDDDLVRRAAATRAYLAELGIAKTWSFDAGSVARSV